MIRYFKKREGIYIEKIIGQDWLAFAHSDTADFYDLIEAAEVGGYRGSVILFFDFRSGDVYKPFLKKRNVVYSDPVYADGFYYFLQGDYDEKKIVLYRYIPDKVLEIVTELSTEEVHLYNLRIIGNPVHIISQEERFECYYPEKISFPMKATESAMLMENGKIYFNEAVEEGWDMEKNCATEQYKCFERVIVKDEQGVTLSEEIGSMYQAPDGTWWIS